MTTLLSAQHALQRDCQCLASAGHVVPPQLSPRLQLSLHSDTSPGPRAAGTRTADCMDFVAHMRLLWKASFWWVRIPFFFLAFLYFLSRTASVIKPGFIKVPAAVKLLPSVRGSQLHVHSWMCKTPKLVSVATDKSETLHLNSVLLSVHLWAEFPSPFSFPHPHSHTYLLQTWPAGQKEPCFPTPSLYSNVAVPGTNSCTGIHP